MISQEEISKLKIFADGLIAEAGNILVKHKSKFKIVNVKDKIKDIVTDADYEVENFLISSIRRAYPGHFILSEELNTVDRHEEAAFVWIIDPLDGTKDFVRGLPFYAVNLAIEYERKMIIALVNEPEINQHYEAVLSRGTFYNQLPAKVSDESDLSKSFVFIRMPDYRMPETELVAYLKIFKKITTSTYRIRSDSWDIEAIGRVAHGAAEGYVLTTSKAWQPPHWWDVAPGILLVEEAGGRVTDFSGNPIVNHDLTNGFIASNGKIHDQLIGCLPKIR